MRRRPAGSTPSSGRTSRGRDRGGAGQRACPVHRCVNRQHASSRRRAHRQGRRLRNLPSKSWRVNRAGSWRRTSPLTCRPGAGCLGCTTRTGCQTQNQIRSVTIVAHPCQARPPRPPPHPENQPRLAVEERVPGLLAAHLRHARTIMTSTNHPSDAEGGHPGAVGAGARPSTPGQSRTPHPEEKRTCESKTDASTISNQARVAPG